MFFQIVNRVPEIKVRYFSGDGTGVFDVISGSRVYAHIDTVRMRTNVNYIVKNGGELILPWLTELAAKRSPCFEVYGGVYGIGELRLHGSSHAQLHKGGHSACFNCSTKYTGGEMERKYWIKKITVKANGKLEVISAAQDINSATQLHTDILAVEYNGLVKSDAIEVFSRYVKVDHDGKLYSSGEASGNGRGPGRSCNNIGGGAGHGGMGGRGAGCSCGVSASGKGVLSMS